jgi:hypothetical protein
MSRVVSPQVAEGEFVLQNSMLGKSEKGKAVERQRRKATGAKAV